MTKHTTTRGAKAASVRTVHRTLADLCASRASKAKKRRVILGLLRRNPRSPRVKHALAIALLALG